MRVSSLKYGASYFLTVALLLLLSPLLAQNRPEPPASGKVRNDYSIAFEYQRNGNFDSAIVFYERYRITSPNSKEIEISANELEKRIFECQSGKELMRFPRKFKVTNLGPLVNSAYEDYAPVLRADEDLLVFTSRRREGNQSTRRADDGKYFEDVFFSSRTNGEWSAAQDMGPPVNTPFHDSNLAMSTDGTQLFLYTDDNLGDILVSEFGNGTWGPPRRLPPPINTPYHESSASISSDGKRIFVASERPGGRGGSDIYAIEKNSAGQWMNATNLGPSINTEWDEDSPFISYNGLLLYFSSKGHNSMGGYDIFRSQSGEGRWSRAENIGSPINTPGHDTYFVGTKDGTKAYYSSIREDTFGEEDLYLITLPDELIGGGTTVPVLNADAREESRVKKVMPPEAGLTIYFSFGADVFSEVEGDRLNSFIQQFVKSENLVIQIDGHTDNIGSDAFNQGLSLARAQSVKSFLEVKGIKPERVTVGGWGAAQPAAPNDQEKDGRELNRRVDIKIISN